MKELLNCGMLEVWRKSWTVVKTNESMTMNILKRINSSRVFTDPHRQFSK